MFKRVVWFGGGVASGVVGSWWTRRKVRKEAERFTTADGIKGEAARQVKRIADRTSRRAGEYLGEAPPDTPPPSTIERYRQQARDRFFDRRRRGSIRAVPDQAASSTSATATAPRSGSPVSGNPPGPTGPTRR